MQNAESTSTEAAKAFPLGRPSGLPFPSPENPVHDLEAEAAILSPFRAYARALGLDSPPERKYLHLVSENPLACTAEEALDFPGFYVREEAFRSDLRRGPVEGEPLPCPFCAKNLRDDDREAEDLLRAEGPQDEA